MLGCWRRASARKGGDLEAALAAGLRADGLGLLISATRSVTQAQDPRQAAEALRERIRRARTQVLDKTRAEGALPSPAYTPHKELIIGLAELGALQFGDFTLASGKRSSLYIVLRLLVSQPSLMQAAAVA